MRLRRSRAPLTGALTAGLGLTLLGILAFKVNRFGRIDSEAFHSFWMLQRPSLNGAEYAVTRSVDPLPLGAVALALAAVAAGRRRPLLLPAIGVSIVGANLSTQFLKSALPAHSTVIPGGPIGTAGSFPSGHATACMSLVLSAVLVAPSEGRRLVAHVGVLYSLVLGYAVLLLATHYPSDVIAGYLMAAMWSFLSIAALRAADPPASDSAHRSGSLGRGAVPPVAGFVSLAMLGAGLAILVGPDVMSPLALTVAAATITLVAAASVFSLRELANSRPGALRS